MNLSKLFEMQRKLDERIVEKKGLQGQDLLPNTILALYAELGELLNEWRGFKHWSDDREPVRKKYRCTCGNEYKENIDCHECSYTGTYFSIEEYDPLLEEYVDCLHFILSIGLQVGIEKVVINKPDDGVLTKDMFFEVFQNLTMFEFCANGEKEEIAKGTILGARIYGTWRNLMESFVRLGELLGFTWEQIEQAYYDKNEVNHQRQSNGY